MAYEQRDLTGSLFKNTRKASDTHADYNGSALVNGVSYFLDAWINTANDGTKYMSLKLKPKDAQQAPRHMAGGYIPVAAVPADLDDDSDVPF
jgi:uncharacterized protein (DUF736 family)